MLTLYNVLDVL